MRITYANTLLASSQLALGRVGPFNTTGPDGRPIVDEVRFFDADFATLFGRGRGAKPFSFGVTALFSSEADAMLFAGLHEDSLPLQGDLVLVDDAESVSLIAEDAIITVRIERIRGHSLDLRYEFQLSRFTSQDVPPFPNAEDIVKTINQALTEGTVEQEIEFDTPFASAPRGITLQLSAPDGGGIFGWQIRESTRTAEGFTIDFDAAVPAAGYKITGVAVL